MELCKAYLSGWQQREKPQQDIADFFFTSNIASALSWQTKSEADLNCAFLIGREIEIRLRTGGQHICRAFKSDKRADGEFIITCDIPPVSEQAA